MGLLNRRTAFSMVCVFLGYLIFIIYGFSLRFKFGFPIEAYWLSFVFVSLPPVFEAVFGKSSLKLRLFYLISFSLMITLQYAIVDSSQFLSSQDAIADYRLADQIITDSKWSPTMSIDWGFGAEYKFYPVTDFLYSTFSLVTGLPLLLVVKFLFVIKAIVVPPLVIKFFRSFFNQRISYLGTILFLASPGAILFPHKESFAIIFFFVSLYAVTRLKNNRKYFLLGIFSFITLVMTHHFTTYVFLFILTSLFLASHYTKHHNNIRLSTHSYLLYLIIFSAWVGFVSFSVLAMQQNLIVRILSETVLPHELPLTEFLTSYSIIERIMVWLGYGIAVISSAIGFLYYYRKRKVLSSSLFLLILFLIVFLGIASVMRLTPGVQNESILVSHRAFEFGYIAIGLLSSLFFISAIQSTKKYIPKLVLIGAIVVMILVGPMAGAMHPRTFSIVSDVVSEEALSLNSWMNESDASSEYTITDKVFWIPLAIYGENLVFRNSDFFSTQDFSLPLNQLSEASYIAIYKGMTEFYGSSAEKFYYSPYFHVVYSSDTMVLFRVGNRTS